MEVRVKGGKGGSKGSPVNLNMGQLQQHLNMAQHSPHHHHQLATMPHGGGVPIQLTNQTLQLGQPIQLGPLNGPNGQPIQIGQFTQLAQPIPLSQLTQQLGQPMQIGQLSAFGGMVNNFPVGPYMGPGMGPGSPIGPIMHGSPGNNNISNGQQQRIVFYNRAGGANGGGGNMGNGGGTRRGEKENVIICGNNKSVTVTAAIPMIKYVNSFFAQVENRCGMALAKKLRKQLKSIEDFEIRGRQLLGRPVNEYFKEMISEIVEGDDQNVILIEGEIAATKLKLMSKELDEIIAQQRMMGDGQNNKDNDFHISVLFVKGFPRMLRLDWEEEVPYYRPITLTDDAANIIPMPFCIIQNVKSYCECPRESLLLLHDVSLAALPDFPIQHYVRLVIHGMMCASQLLDRAKSFGTAFRKHFMECLTADAWLLELDNAPICVVELRKSFNDLENPHVIGGLYDRLVKLRSQQSRRDIFGILTCYDGWRIVWLPDSNYIAQSDTETCAEILEDEEDDTSMSVESEVKRELYGTEILYHSDNTLPRILVSLLRKLSTVHVKKA
jgi:hypothetical protein